MNFFIITIIYTLLPIIGYSISSETNEQINYDNKTKESNISNNFTSKEYIEYILEYREELREERDEIITDEEIDLEDTDNNIEIPLYRLEYLSNILLEIKETDDEILNLISHANYDFYQDSPACKNIILDTKYNYSLIPFIDEVIIAANNYFLP